MTNLKSGHSHFCFSEVFWNYGQQSERSLCFSWIWLWNYGQHMEWAFCFSGKKEFWKYGTVQFWWTLYPHWKQWKQHGRSPDWCFIIPHDGETFFVTRFIARCLYSRWRLLSNSRHILECHSYIFIYFLPYLNVRWMFFCIILNFFGIFKGNFGNPWKLLVTDGNSIARSW